MTILLDGKGTAQQILQDIATEAQCVRGKPTLSFILMEGHFASDIYVRKKKSACSLVGFSSKEIRLPSTATEKEILQIINKENRDPHVHGILVQQPFPSHFSVYRIVEAIDPRKDVDGFHPYNMGQTLLGDSDGFRPCTPLGIIALLKKYSISLAGKHIVVLGRSNIVGKPLAAMLMQKNEGGNATVTLLHSHSKNIVQHVRSADIVITAMGQPHFLHREYITEGSVVVDVGINRMSKDSAKIVGDVNFADVFPICSHITPVPGGIGPMTIAMLMANTWISYMRAVQ